MTDDYPRPLVIAHRGASGYRPEHSRAAYELALEMGADAIEPDIVASSDGVLVLRHENEISDTTNVAFLSEFAGRRTTKVIDGVERTGWFTEDFTWAELSTLRTAERLPKIRRGSATFIGGGGILRLRDLLEILDAAGRAVILVAEIKHATYFASIGLPLDELFAAEIAHWATADNLIVESFEQTVLQQIRARGVAGRLVFLIDAEGGPADLLAQEAASGVPARSYADHLTNAGLTELAHVVDGVSLAKSLIMRRDASRHVIGITDVVARAHLAGLIVFVWTLRAENTFLPRNLRIGVRPSGYGDWPAEFALILSSGVDGVFADQPDLALRARWDFLAVTEAPPRIASP
ncbi:glycerophosphoryl diester phosphodiesterase [Glaciihabitans tibetensis]|uniref:glycerophosphodiester phosphodiesterase n=1 Tax=Glaciihabitans tibetensis TaxID=1266600 RepID=A0A2T0VBZ3_9MICO|nr:glycerophosphodiester phosphodiesterase family protein [Glaciihabitans tibetensis]PRY67617.1 glycerophosphoryl diester phosphodiesterase [Glaciihabitans tibetensis]